MNLGGWLAELLMKMQYRSALRHSRQKLIEQGKRSEANKIYRVMYGDGLEELMMISLPVYGDWIDDAERFIELIVQYLPQLMELIVLIISLLDNVVPRPQYLSSVSEWQIRMRTTLQNEA